VFKFYCCVVATFPLSLYISLEIFYAVSDVLKDDEPIPESVLIFKGRLTILLGPFKRHVILWNLIHGFSWSPNSKEFVVVYDGCKRSALDVIQLV
jgi:hypothetical protein